MLKSLPWPRLKKWVLLASAVAFPLPAIVIALRSYRIELAGFDQQRHPVPLSEETAALEGIEAVEFRSADGNTIRGWYVPSKNRSGVVLTHGSGTDRSALLPEARLLANRGFGVLLFDFPGHGESEGEVHWNEGERSALTAAVDWLSTRADLDPDRLGAYGFSMGGYILAQVSAFDPRIRAVALAGTPPDPVEHTRWEYRRWGPLSQVPALWAVRRGGVPLDRLLPKDLAPRIAPRRLLIIAGSQDELVPVFMARELYDAARPPKQLLLVEGAAHGTYEKAAHFPEQFAAFFEEALLGNGR